MSRTINVGDVIEVKIEKIVPGGYGLGFAEGYTFFVALSAPQDVLNARVVKIKGRTAFAEVEKVISASPFRTDPECSYFGRCGGCDLQQLDISSQLAAKKAIIRDCIERIGKIHYEDDIRIISSPEPFGYRLRAQWHVDTIGRKIGYYRRDSRDLVEIEDCPVLAPELRQRLSQYRSEMPWDMFFSDRSQIDAACGSDGSVSTYSPDLPEATNDIDFRTTEERYIFSARSFSREPFSGRDWSKLPLKMPRARPHLIFVRCRALPCARPTFQEGGRRGRESGRHSVCREESQQCRTG